MLGARSGATASNAKIENSTERCLGISEKDNKILTDFLGRSVTIGTAKSYQIGIKKWKAYLDTLDKDYHPGEYLEMLDDPHKQIKKAVTSVAYMLEVKGLSTSFIHVALVTRGRAATSRSSKECREHEEKRGKNVILPICLSIVLEIRQQYWESQDWDMKGMDKRGI
jgi:hypothetical protein